MYLDPGCHREQMPRAGSELPLHRGSLPLPRGMLLSILGRWSRATKLCEPRQVRKEATVTGHFGCSGQLAPDFFPGFSRIDSALAPEANDQPTTLGRPLASAAIGSRMIVASMLAISFSSSRDTAKASAEHTVRVRPARLTSALATNFSPAAGANRFTLNSTLSTSTPSGATLRAA